MRNHLPSFCILASFACTGEPNNAIDSGLDTSNPQTDSGNDPSDTGEDSGTIIEEDGAAWTLLVFMNGDNDLESSIWGDLNELEMVGSNADVNVIVQVDRHADYWRGDGDWTEARRYYIEADTDPDQVVSTLVESLGEVDMGDPAVLEDFLAWAHEHYPADRYAVSMWNHGDGWSVRGGGQAPFISWDMTDNGWMSIAAGQFNAGLDAFVAEREQPIEIIAFDACSMASWEVAHSLRDRADFMVGSETTVGLDGFHYTEILRALQENPEMETSELADLFAWSAGDYNEEWTFSVTDISKIDALSSTIDALATEVLADEELSSSFLDHRDAARGADHTWRDYYLDLGDLARVLSETDEPRLTEHGAAIAAALDDAIPHNYTRQPYRWVGGLTIYADLSWDYLADYVDGTGASWSQDTQWDDLLVSLAEEREN